MDSDTTRADELEDVPLLCVRCQAGQLHRRTQDILRCNFCQASYPVLHGVPIVLPDVLVESSGSDRHPELADYIRRVHELPDEARHVAAIQDIFKTRYRFSNHLVTTESRQYLDRLHRDLRSNSSPGPSKPPSGSPAPSCSIARQQLAGLPEIRNRWLTDYIPRVLGAGRTLFANVRIENTGNEPISSQKKNPICISYHWLALDGEHCLVDEHRTPLPIVLLPRRQLTVPMLLTTPKNPGDYHLQLCLVEEHIRWLQDSSTRIAIQITEPSPADPSESWNKSTEIVSYAEDHQRALRLLDQRVTRWQEKNRIERPRILEIGGNSNPMIQNLGRGELYNVDVDVHGLQVGHLINRSKKRSIRNVCADANELPFADRFFDIIVTFASLHHFPDLRLTLQNLARKIQPRGFISVLCEPVGYYFGEQIDASLLEELRKGVNEQTFQPEEYANMFRGSGLIADEVWIQGSSLKAFLTLPDA